MGTWLASSPRRVLGRDLFWWVERLGIWAVSVDTLAGREANKKDFLIKGASKGPNELRRACGVELVGRTLTTQGRTFTFSDGAALEVSNVVWATGFRGDYDWVNVPVFDAEGRPLHKRGVTESPGLYFLGLRWQHSMGSGLTGFVKHDARFIAEVIASREVETPS